MRLNQCHGADVADEDQIAMAFRWICEASLCEMIIATAGDEKNLGQVFIPII